MKIEGKVLIGGDEIGTFSIGFDLVIMTHFDNGGDIVDLFHYASESGQSIELVPTPIEKG